MQKIVVWGASGHALVVADIIKLKRDYEILGFIDDVNVVHPDTKIYGVPVISSRNELEKLRINGLRHIIFGFGNCEARLKLAVWVRENGYILATAIHPTAIVASDVIVGDGTVIAAGTVVNPGAIIGENVIVNTCASVDHECVIEDGVHISPGVHLAGKVRVGRGTWIGIGSTVIDRVNIGAGTLIGAGSVVVSDLPDGVLAYGVPAKQIKRI